jgi:malonyl-CoA O-methyltransferase
MSIDRKALARSFAGASAQYDAAGELQRDVRSELLSRLEHFDVQPRCILDLGAGTGVASRELQRRFPKALVVAADLSLGMLQYGNHNLGLLERLRLRNRPMAVNADALRLPIATQSVDIVFSSLMLQWCDLDLALREVRRTLRQGGLFLFSTFGATTLQELRQAWLAVDDKPRMLDFFDAHDIGAALVRAGFSEPVIDVDRYRREYRDPLALMKSIKDIGAVNSLVERSRGLLGRRTLQAVCEHYPRRARDAATVATWEVVFGTAFGTAPAGEDNEVLVPLAQLQVRRRG